MPVSRNINEPYAGTFQVRIVRQGKEYSATFNVASYESRDAALTAAEAWRDELLTRLPKYLTGLGSYRLNPLSNKKSWGRQGISRYIHEDNRYGSNIKNLRFSVNWVDGEGYPRLKSFEVGRLDTITWENELHGSLTAEAFRAEWEHCQLHGLVFDPSQYEGWKDKILFPFDAQSSREAASN